MNYYDDLIKNLKDTGFRLTKLRKGILKELDSARKPLSAADIMDRLQEQGLIPHKTSVYREISFLLKQEIIIKITFGEKQDLFELADMKHHHHAACQRCGEIEDIDCSAGIREIEKKLDSRGFKVNFHLVEFIGLCRKCDEHGAS
jgi:Fur family ferric uptake transcriptional regulator